MLLNKLICFTSLSIISISKSSFSIIRPHNSNRFLSMTTMISSPFSSSSSSAAAVTTVTTYNVLSSSLGSADYFIKCDPDACDPSKRLPLVKLKLEKEIEKKSIICLQELSIDWIGEYYLNLF